MDFHGLPPVFPKHLSNFSALLAPGIQMIQRKFRCGKAQSRGWIRRWWCKSQKYLTARKDSDFLQEIHIIHIWAEKGLVQWCECGITDPNSTCEAYLNACYQKHVSISSSRRKLGPLCFLGPHDIPAVMRHFQNIKTSENIRIFDLAKLILAKVAWNLPKTWLICL